MGSSMDRPNQVKNYADEHDDEIWFGVAAMQGWSKRMEDAHCTHIKLSSYFPRWYFFAVFDGHGGEAISKYAAEYFKDILVNELKAQFPKGAFVTPSGDARSCDIEQERVKIAVEACFKYLDEEMRNVLFKNGEGKSGSTAVGLLLTPQNMYLINCGDSRALLVRGTEQKATVDHKPTNPAEIRRIVEAGGHVTKQRVNGVLGVSRSLGDFDFKSKGKQAIVSAEPDIIAIKRDLIKDEFVILACDGAWDVMSNAEVAGFVRSRLPLKEQLSHVCGEVLDTCLYKGSRDNISMTLVVFDKAYKKYRDKDLRNKAFMKEYQLEYRIFKAAKGILDLKRSSGENDRTELFRSIMDKSEEYKELLPPGGGLYAKRGLIEDLYDRKFPQNPQSPRMCKSFKGLEKTHEVTLRQGTMGLGIEIEGGIDRPYPKDDSNNLSDPRIYVISISPYGSAYQDGRIKTGDVIMEADNIHLDQVPHWIAIKAIYSEEPVTIKFYTPDKKDEGFYTPPTPPQVRPPKYPPHSPKVTAIHVLFHYFRVYVLSYYDFSI